jgi:hypothetical protein
VAESENVYVKIGERGRLIERTADREIDHVNLRATGWVLKGSKKAPSKKLETAGKPVRSGLTETAPTSLRAQSEATEDTTAGSTRRTTTAADSAGARADAKSQAAAGA